MSELVPFDYGDRTVRTHVDSDGNTWFVAQDVCAVLGLTHVNKATQGLDDDERNTVPHTDSSGRSQDMVIISEPGLYTLLVRSRRPEAKPFRRWVTHEVLPQLRRTGSYSTEQDPVETVPVARDHFDAMRAMAVAHVAMIDELARQDRSLRAVEGHVSQLDERVAAIESAPNWRTSTGWAQLRGWAQTDIPTLSKLGSRAAKIAKAQHLEESKVLDINGRFMVNRWPLAIWDQAATELGWIVS